MIPVTTALEAIRQQVMPLASETCPLADLQGRVLREAVASAEDLPGFDRSAMDGYAVRADDLADEFEVVAEIRAGQAIDCDLKAGQAVRIFTGARLPGSGLKVVMQEHVAAGEGRMRITKRTAATNIRLRGEDARAGEVLLQPGTVLDATAIALLASVGKTSVLVSRQPRILHITTGDEVISPEKTQRRADSEQQCVADCGALSRERSRGDHTFSRGRCSDGAAAACFRGEGGDLRSGFDFGWIGPGELRFSAASFPAFGATIHFREVNVRPGKPLIFGTTKSQIVFGLPGNALSLLSASIYFVRRALERMLARPE